MRTLTERLIVAERRIGRETGAEDPAAFRVCEKLRQPLSTFAGNAGYRALLSRAWVLAKVNSPLLGEVQITPDGSFRYSAKLNSLLKSPEVEKAGGALADELIGLLLTFIGEALTLRLVQDVWSTVATKNLSPQGE